MLRRTRALTARTPGLNGPIAGGLLVEASKPLTRQGDGTRILVLPLRGLLWS